MIIIIIIIMVMQAGYKLHFVSLDFYSIFAYGQTGSGKTFTMMGGGNKTSMRGLIPRITEALFTETIDNPVSSDALICIHVSHVLFNLH